MKHVLVLGAGQSTSYLIQYLLHHAEELDWMVTICDRSVTLAQQAAAGHPRAQAVAFDIADSATRSALIGKADVVINMLTRSFQHLVALECINHGVHMLSASYEDAKVGSLDVEAHRKNILILNELGLDPGIDHMLAMSRIQAVHARGGIVTSFKSYGTGLPSPDLNPNPLQYVITWNPRNVLMAGEDGAIYKEDGKIKILPFHAVFQRTWTVEIEGLGTFEAYPNRDSLSYETELGLDHVQTIIRGTLRYPGWSETWQQIVHLGMTNEILPIPDLKNKTYAELTEMFLPETTPIRKLEQQVARHLGVSPTGRIMSNLRWLGIFSKQKIGIEAKTAAEVMIHLIKEKMKMPAGARDMVILHLETESLFTEESNRKEKTTTTMIEYATTNGTTAIARTVGLPVAIATKLLLTGKLPLRGCHIPTHKGVYEPILKELELSGLIFQENVTTVD